MSRSFKGITLHEGYNDIGSFEVNITNIEEASSAVSYAPVSFPPVSRKLLFRLQFDDGKPVTQAYKGAFEVLGRAESENTLYEAHPNADGFIEIDTPVFPVVPKPEDEEEQWLLRLSVNGPLNERAEESYIKVFDASFSSVYTLVWDVCVYGGYLTIRSEAGNYYNLATGIAVSSLIHALHITATGKVFGLNAGTGAWSDLGTLEFTAIEFPENLDTVEDGFYKTTGTTGTVTTWEAGGTGFEDYSLSLLNPGVYLVNVEVNVTVEPTGNVFSGTFSNKMPGSLDYIPVTVSGVAPIAADDSPTIGAIETVSGITFSVAFTNFLSSKELTTIDRVRKAGPIQYIADFPSGDVGEAELKALQGHVDFYSVNTNTTQNQRILSQGYTGIYEVANKPKDLFLADVVNDDLPLFKAAQVHETVVQNQKLVRNLLAGTLADLKLDQPSTPAMSGSGFVDGALGNAVNSCGCDDCKSGISPFAYMMDLLKYAAAHVTYNSRPTYRPGDFIGNFITIISNKFKQPFYSLNVDCDTLHDEYCRVRLVTEVLEAVFSENSYIIPAIQQAALTNERKQYLQLVYQTILSYAGTSFNELRDIVAIQPLDKKTEAAQKLTNRLSIPLYVSTTANLTVDAMWLTLTATVSSQILNAVNLETVFGFRDTQRSVLSPTPTSLFDNWHKAYLRDVWKKQDYAFTAYSREGVDPSDDSTFKTNWKPILDPDIIGWDDFTYKTSADITKIWKHRKTDTDSFLEYCLTTPVSRTSADMRNRILRVSGKNLLSQVIENNTVSIINSTPAWIPFHVLNLKLTGTNTDVFLDQVISPGMFQPQGTNPGMRYNRVVDVSKSFVSGSGTTTIVIDWPEDVIADKLSSGYVKFQSVSGSTITTYETTGTTNQITGITINNAHNVTLTVNNTNIDTTFLNGVLSFVYEVEVMLYTTEIVDPVLSVNNLFGTTQTYTVLTSSTTTNPITYKVWSDPGGGWPVFLTAPNPYGRLKQMQAFLAAGTYVDEITVFISTYLYMNNAQFNRMMVLFNKAENYLPAMYTSDRPTTEELYELASIFRNAAKTPLRLDWLKEEIQYDVAGIPLNVQLDGSFFWKALSEPVTGPWDPSLQVLPIIDPELISYNTIVNHPEAKPYRSLYNDRVNELTFVRAYISSYIRTNVPSGFTDALNLINNNDPLIAYDIFPYTGVNALSDLMNDLTGLDIFKQKLATDTVWGAFAITKDNFIAIIDVKNAYEGPNPALSPTDTVLEKTIDLLLSGYKVKQRYPIWISEETTGSYPSGVPVFYYNVFELRLAPGRTDPADRKDWQRTLAAWNRQAFVQPDLVPPENIIDFVTTNWVYTAWNARNTALISANTTLATYFNATVSLSDLLLNLRGQLDLVISRTNSYTTPSGTLHYVDYFTALKTKEENGEDIRPYLEQFGITITEYRYLRHIYDVLDSSSPAALIDSEYQDIINILIHIHSKNLPFTWVVEEYEQDLILSDEKFQIYKPALDSFPLTDLPVYNQWRSPYADRKAWKDILETRIDRKQIVTDKWKEVLGEAEDRNMPLLRDALIRALTQPCEKWQDAAERLAKTYFIETKDNCCVKHTRVSFALETLQGLLYALQNGIYDGFVSSFSISAPNFSQEWQWLGSYATWRAAVFVFIYPENLLYPTLKRKQSPAFLTLANTVQNANRFTPEDACNAAKEYEKYLDDLLTLETVCTTTVNTNSYANNPADCCGDESLTTSVQTFYIAQGKSGTTYWSCKSYNDNSSGAHSFWQAIPIEQKNIKPIGCFALGERSGNPWNNIKLSLGLFYTFLDSGKLKMGYIQKDVFKPGNNEWTDEKETEDLPKFDTTDALPYGITACQSRVDWYLPSFIFSYAIGNANHHVGFDYNWITDKFDTIALANKPHYVTTNAGQVNLITAIKYTHNSTITIPLVAMVFDNETVIYASLPGFGPINITSVIYTSLVGAFQNPDDDQTLIVVYRDSNIVKAKKIKLLGGFIPDLTSITIGSEMSQLKRIYPVFSQWYTPVAFAVKIYAAKTLATSFFTIDHLTVQTANFVNLISIAPEKAFEHIQSADCVKNMNIRAANVRIAVQANMNYPQGTSINTVLRTTVAQEVVNEAYYFVPMLLALDQQKRGQFEAALSWYRTVYDYTMVLVAQRKIFYGLVVEQSIVNSYAQASNWLLDPLNPHLIAKTRANAYTKYTLMNIIQCMYGYADREFTMDTIETVPIARKLYTEALELSKVKELKLKPNACTGASQACLAVKINEPAMRPWANLYAELTERMSAIGNATIIEGLVDEIAGLINTATEATYAAHFAEAFELVEAAIPSPPTVLNVYDFIAGSGTRVDLAYSYLSALNPLSAFSTNVATQYAEAVALVSGLTIDTVAAESSEASLSWLTQAIPDNATNYKFKFANTDGKQRLNGDSIYNPLNPTLQAYKANLAYSNLPRIIGEQMPSMPQIFTPSVDYKFCMPENPIYKSLELKGNLELYKIFNCRNIAGMVRELDVYAAPTDSVTGMPVIGAGGNLILPGIGTFAPSQYRFRVLIERAKQIAAQAQQMESLFLSALEKEDAENYSLLKAKQDLQTAKATVKLQDLRINQANDEKGVADLQLGKAVFTQAHFSDLIAAGLNSFESQSLENLKTSMILSTVASAAGLATATASASDPRSNAAGIGQLIIQAANIAAGVFSQLANMQSQLASYARRTEEWSFQRDLAGLDIGIANQQIKVTEDNIRIVTQEREIAQINTDHAQDSLDFLKNKFTNAELYRFMGNTLERSYSYMLNLATSIAKTAESQLYFERQEQAGPFILDDYWETPSAGSIAGSGDSTDRRGLTGSARLAVDITRLDQYAFDTNKRKLQMTKIISLSQNFPSEFQQFRETGILDFELTNKLFDYDFPGHYLRLVNSVKTTVVGLLPVYDNIKATLTASNLSYTVIGGTIFQKTPIKRMQLDSVALTAPTNATGVFEMQQMQGEFPNPFEGMGVESRWEFSMPRFSNRIDYSNIADVLITMEYTALDSYQYRYQVLQDLDYTLKFNRGFSFKNNFPDQWYDLAQAQSGSQSFGVTLELKREMFPQGIDNLKSDGSPFLLYFVRADGFTDEVSILDFNLAADSTEAGGQTIEGKFNAAFDPSGASPAMKLRLAFDNTPENRELFSEEKITDILLMVGCKADLRNYPL